MRAEFGPLFTKRAAITESGCRTAACIGVHADVGHDRSDSDADRDTATAHGG